MIARVSTNGLHERGLSAMLLQQSKLAKVQQQLASGLRLTRAADDPAAAAGAIALDQALGELKRYAGNSAQLEHRLQLEEGALAGAADVLARVRELAVAVNNGNHTDTERRAIATELRQHLDQLIGIANGTDGAGRYLFGGTADGSEPFARGLLGVTYSGDQGQRLIAVAPGVELADGDPGSEVFQRIASGNGTFSARAAAANAGSGVIRAASVVDGAAWDGDSYRIEFAAGSYQVLDSANAVVVNGVFTPGTAIQFAGVSVTLGGTPADGDSFTVTPSASQDLFTTVQNLIVAVETPGTTAADNADRQNAYFSAQQDLSRALEHLADARAAVGARLVAAETAATQRETAAVDTETALAGLRDLDYAEAVTRMQMLLTALQAAQQTYQRVQGSSLFDYLR